MEEFNSLYPDQKPSGQQPVERTNTLPPMDPEELFGNQPARPTSQHRPASSAQPNPNGFSRPAGTNPQGTVLPVHQTAPEGFQTSGQDFKSSSAVSSENGLQGSNQQPYNSQQQPVIVINNTNQNHNEMSQTQSQVQQTNDVPAVVKSKWTAFWLCLFLGVFGAHQFYCGWTTKGFIMLGLSLTGAGTLVTFFWALFDLVKILLGSFPVKHGLPV